MSYDLADADTFAKLKEMADKLQVSIRKVEKNMKHVRGSGEMHKLIPQGVRETAKIDHVVSTGSDLMSIVENLKAATHNVPERACPPGTYTRLLTPDALGQWEVMMTDAPYELRSSRQFYKNAHGNVLVAGLGLGATLPAVLRKTTVATVTVIEKNQDVIDLVYPHLRHGLPMRYANKLHVVVGDARTWRPGRRMGPRPYHAIWLDIWPDVSTRNLDEMHMMAERYSKWLNLSDPKCWLGVWEIDRVLKLRDEQDRAVDKMYSAVGGRLPTSVKIGKRTVKL